MITKDDVMDALRQCYDPEIPNINIVDLGLIYDIQVNNDKVEVKMTLTAPGCPMHSYMSQDAKQKVSNLTGVKDVNVEVVWDPQWNPDMMSEDAKRKLGFM